MNRNFNSNILIWIAEDDTELREILGASLAHGQREIRLFEDGQAVLEATKKSSFDILVTDLIMPGADGIQILKEVKKLYPESIVIIMTGYASLDSAIQAIRGGAYDYIRKPFKLEEMEIVITNACEKIFLMRENRYLLQRLKETMEELDRLKENWDEHLANILDMGWMISDAKKKTEMEIVLKQINPMPPDYDYKKKEFQKKGLDDVDRLVQLRKEGFIDEDEFLLLKKILLKKLSSSGTR